MKADFWKSLTSINSASLRELDVALYLKRKIMHRYALENIDLPSEGQW